MLRANDRERSDQEIGDYILATVARPPEVLNLEMSRDGSGAGALGATKPIVVELFGNDLDELEQASQPSTEWDGTDYWIDQCCGGFT